MATCSTAHLVEARVRAAAQLQTAIEAVGRAYRDYQQATRALEFRASVDLDRYLLSGITRHLSQAGLAEFLERKLAGAAPSLAGLVEQQHRRVGVASLET
jgi:hypothetical protein